MEEYIEDKLRDILEDNCDCHRNNICGICFWKGIIKPRNEWTKNVCRKCIVDLDQLKFQIENTTETRHIKIKANCDPQCLWWDWFHSRRVALSKRKNVTFEYKRNNN